MVLIIISALFYFNKKLGNSDKLSPSELQNTTSFLSSKCPEGYTYLKGGLLGDKSKDYCSKVIKTPDGFTTTKIIPINSK